METYNKRLMYTLDDFIKENNEVKIYKLKKDLYGLKPTAYARYNMIDRYF